MDFNPRKTLLYFIVWRVLAVYIVQTSHVPDEYWQSLEVAHRFTFGYGYLTWEWRTKIRSYIYPFLLSIVYKVLQVLQLDFPIVLIMLPRLFQAVLSAYADYRFYMWTKSKWATFGLILNWYWYYCSTRTLTNTLETSLTTIALSMFPWKSKNSNTKDCEFLWIIGFTCAIRPTMAITWIPLCTYHLLINLNSIFDVLYQYFFIAVTTLTYATLIDCYCYDDFVITPWEFFRVNVLNNIAGFYGTHDSFWYITVALPVMLGMYCIYLPLAIYQVLNNYKINSKEFVLLFTSFWTIFIYSLMEHKEFRFILPTLPILIYICACTELPDGFDYSDTIRKILIGIFVLTNLLPMSYFSFVHQKGPLEVMKILRDELNSYDDNYRRHEVDVLFLTPCHATPMYSHIHRNATVRFLTCEPNLEGSDNYVDEADQFFQSPMKWLNDNYNIREKNLKQLKLPAIVVIYDNVVDRIGEFLKFYRLVATTLNAHFPQSNYGKNIHIYKHKLLKY